MLSSKKGKRGVTRILLWNATRRLWMAAGPIHRVTPEPATQRVKRGLHRRNAVLNLFLCPLGVEESHAFAARGKEKSAGCWQSDPSMLEALEL